MKLYLAGVYTSNFDIGGRLYNRLSDAERQVRDNLPYLLESYHYIHKQSYVDKIRRDGRQVFLDSGAFSAFTQGIEVDLNAYCRYIHENKDIIEVASVLDSIGSAQGTYDNQVAMEKQGVCPLPCFHFGEDERYLEWYVANYDYITLGGMVPISTPQLIIWLDRLWEKYLTDDAGRPKIKVHGFGLTSSVLMLRYPWYSVDSSGWVQASSRGQVRFPKQLLGIEDNQFAHVYLSKNNPARKEEGHHLDNYSLEHQDAIIGVLERAGFEMDRLQNYYFSCWVANLWGYMKMQDIVNDHGDKFWFNEKPIQGDIFDA